MVVLTFWLMLMDLTLSERRDIKSLSDQEVKQLFGDLFLYYKKDCMKEEESERHVAWPMSVLDIDEVKGEVDFLLNKPFLTMDNEYDQEIRKKFGLMSTNVFEGGQPKTVRGVKAINEIAKGFGLMFNQNIRICKKYNVKIWFTFHYM
mgnify:CR=1 FL=1